MTSLTGSFKTTSFSSSEIGKIKTRDDDLTKEAQKILTMINNLSARLDTIEEACHNNFGRISSEISSINASIKSLQNEIYNDSTLCACYYQPVETDS
ncbi:hypothetical protein RhiirA4_488330 [Rhizophagus irregularis]|uniref:Uncharacterized protein n=1 Tax=Rhizophagus irregularis TaxID=588596 RepID=A0A2I1HTJ9_9GLOM|nr:hypothetical protein RhiirA4_488330 [Rhizophagus irregularis]